MTSNRTFMPALLVAAGLLGGIVLMQIIGGGGNDADGLGERTVIYWQAPMDPNYRSDKPGKSPMGMDLIPVYEGEDNQGTEPALRISPAVINNIGIRTDFVTRQTLNREINTVGFITHDDDLTSHVHTRTEGWIENLVVKTAGERVKMNDVIFQMYSPNLVNAQAEYLQALRIGNKSLAEASRQRLLALGMTAPQINHLTEKKEVDQLVDVTAPQDGFVTALNVGEGMFIKPGTTVFSLSDLRSIWVMVDIFEDQATWVTEGQHAKMRLPFIPGKAWHGRVDYVYPTIDPRSRTVQVRLEFENADELLKPNMYAEVTVHGNAQENALSIPREALIRTGQSERVIIDLGDGRFRPAKVTTGIESGGRVETLEGVKEGERIVVSGQFLIDSEASLDASFLRMSEDESGVSDEGNEAAHEGGHSGHGKETQ